MPIQRKDFTGLDDIYMDTASFNIDPSFRHIFLQDPKEIDQRRLKAYEYFMKFYKGRQWEETGEFNPAFGWRSFAQEEFNRRTWNIAQNVVNKLVAFCAKEPWSIKLPQEIEDAYQDLGLDEDQNEDTNEMYEILDSVWDANNRMMFTYDMFVMGCITGDCFVKMSYDPDFYADGMGEVKFDVLDSRLVIPFFDGMDRRKMIGCRIEFPTYEIQDDGSKKKVIFKEIHTPSIIINMIDDVVDQVIQNPLGELLVVHIKNEPLPFERFGRSDLEDLVMPNKEYNEKVSDLSEILAYHAAPITVVKGARIQTLEKGAQKIWGGIPKDGDVFNLNLESDLQSSLEYLQRLKTHMHETSGVPEEALGALQEVSNTSGSALHLQYQPILDRIAKKQVCYQEGLAKLNELTLKFYEEAGAIEIPEDVKPSLRYKTTIEWGDALPRDRSIDLADISTEMGLQIESKKGALERLGIENPEAKLEEIKQEVMEQAEMDFLSAGMAGFGDPAAGPDPMGAASGADDGTQNDVSGAVKQAKTNPITQGEQTSVQAVKKSAQTNTGAFAKKK